MKSFLDRRLFLSVADFPAVAPLVGAMSSTAFDNLRVSVVPTVMGSFSYDKLATTLSQKEALLLSHEFLLRDINEYVEQTIRPAIDKVVLWDYSRDRFGIFTTRQVGSDSVGAITPDDGATYWQCDLPVSPVEWAVVGCNAEFDTRRDVSIRQDDVWISAPLNDINARALLIEQWLVRAESITRSAERFRAFLRSALLDLTRKCLKLFNEIISTLFRRFRTPEFLQQLLVVQSPWHLLHGTHPPEVTPDNCFAFD